MTDVGQALRQDIADQGNILSDSIMRQGALTDAFGAIVRESTLLNDSKYDMYDLEDNYGSKITGDIDGFLERFERAEYSLGHVLDHSDAIDKAFLEDTSNVISISDHHNFQYSLKNTASEQDSASLSGDKVDDNVSSDIFRQKIGIVDPEAESKKARIRAQRDMIALAIQDDQQKLMIEIRELRERIEEIKQEEAELLALEQTLDDGNINDQSARGSNLRRRAESLLKEQGRSLEEFKRADGTINQEALRQALDQQIDDKQESLLEERLKKEDTLSEKEAELSNYRSQTNTAEFSINPDEPVGGTQQADIAMQSGGVSAIASSANEDLAGQDEYASTSEIDNYISSFFQDVALPDQNQDAPASSVANIEIAENSGDISPEASNNYDDSYITSSLDVGNMTYASSLYDDIQCNVISAEFCQKASGDVAQVPDADHTVDSNNAPQVSEQEAIYADASSGLSTMKMV